MKSFGYPFVALLLSALLPGCGTQQGNDAVAADGPQSDSHYQYRARSRDGTGKVYMGREISQVMGHLGAAWLERPTREREERTW